MISALFVFCACFCASIDAQVFVQPEQIHLSYGGDPSLMWVTWVTFDDIATPPLAEIGQGALTDTVKGTTTKFVDGGSEKRTIYVHRVLFDKLKAGQNYLYHVGSEKGWSSIYYFTALKGVNDDWSPRFAVYGDMGNKNGRSLGYLQQETQRGHFDAILHVGDMAYDMDTNNARVADQFMRQIEPIAAYVPYMTVVGNHENAYNFSNYVNRFTMPGGGANLMYSFDIGRAHFIVLSTEFYFYVEYGWQQIANQYEWLQQDLKKANANRDNVPWIVTMGHRPMYCSNWDSDDCTKFESIIRGGLPYIHAYALEPLFYKYGVDLELWAHEHSYERMFPLYNRTVYNTTDDPYNNPPAPVHVVTGSAGCQENTDAFIPHPPPWSAFRSSDYGYSRMTVYNKTHLYYEQVSDDQKGAVIDHFWIRKDKHVPFTQLYEDEANPPPTGHYVPLDMPTPHWFKGKCKKCSQL